MRELKGYIECGKITGKHGLLGEVRTEVWLDSIEDFRRLSTVYLDESGNRAMQAERCRPAGNVVLLKLQGVDSPEAANALRGRTLYAKREDLSIPDGRVLICDLYGLDVFDAKNDQRLGVLSDVIKNPANDIYVIKTDTGEEHMVPAVPAFLSRIDLDAGIWLNVIEGMF